MVEMTVIFDDNARLELKSSISNYNLKYNGMKVHEMEVERVSVSFARMFIATYHYTKTMPDSTKHCFAGYYGDVLAGIVVFGMGSGKNQYTSLIPNIKNGEYLELTRLWSPDGMPHNTESKLIMKSISMLPSEIKLIVSFADPSRNHAGTIYQATNFYYCGMSSGGKVLVTSDGIEKHPRLLGIYKMRHPEYKDLSNKELMKMYNWKYKISSPKHRYVLLRGNKFEKKQMHNQIVSYIQSYPKMDKYNHED